MQQLASKLAGRVKFARVNIDEASTVTRSYGIESLPTFLFVERGQEKARAVGALDPVALRLFVARHVPVGRTGANGERRASR